MIKHIRVLVFFFMPLAFFLASCKPQDQKGKPEEESFGATPVKVIEVKKQRISEKLKYSGVIEAWKKVNITPDVGGKIVRIHVEEGETVKEGQLLAELDTKAIRLQLEQAKAAVAVAEAGFKDAKRNKERMERLRKENAVSEQQYEKIKLAYEGAEAQLQQAHAALNLAQHNLDVSLMEAPFSGVVASRNAEVGDVINPMMGGFSPNSGVLTLMDFSRVKFGVDVTQKDINLIKKGQIALLRTSAFPDKVFQGRVALVNQTADPVTKKFRVEVWADNPDKHLRPNTFGEVTFEVKTLEEALAVPQKAVLDNSYVFLAKGNKAEKRSVSLGLQNSDLVAVEKGIQEGDLVIVEGNFGLQDGALIEVKEVIE